MPPVPLSRTFGPSGASKQRRYGAEFRRLAEFSDLLHRAAALGDDVVRLAHDGLTTGLFDPLPEGE
ncbi:hypothetical protein [Streptosporangium sp. KLBMP 9127]|nr:hypothetical protein [Streptosporangium sp. KLBMP 9127]